MIEWICDYMPHVWSNTLLKSMPENTKMQLSPHSNGAQVQWIFTRKMWDNQHGRSKMYDHKLEKRQAEIGYDK